MGIIGAKDLIDRALVKQYAKIQTANLDNTIRITQDEMWDKIALLSLVNKNQISLYKYQKAA
jgi:hypothetical protein